MVAALTWTAVAGAFDTADTATLSSGGGCTWQLGIRTVAASPIPEPDKIVVRGAEVLMQRHGYIGRGNIPGA